jgi:hypothetical protein
MESIITMPPSKECSVCLEKVTGSVRKEVPCQYCQYAACLTCVKRYMLESPQDAHCMNCKRAWNREFIDSHLSMSFRKNALKNHREAILLDREKARLPLLQPRISAKVRADDMNKDILDGLRAIQDMEKTIAAARQEVYRSQNRQHRLREIAAGRIPPEAENQEADKKEVRQFTQKCPVDDCRGFLSSQWKCGTCQTYVCHECLVPKGKDRDAAHTCNEDTKATAALIRKETKPCPKCGMGISKVDGCDQMWCISCQTPFSWTTGRLVFGVVHNPHYYQWLREQNGGEAPRVAGDVPCGGLVNFYTIERGFTQKIYPGCRKKEVEAIHRLAAELLDQHLRQFARFDEVPDNGDLGIDYTLKLINEEEWKKKLWQRETKREKSLELRGPLDLLANVCSEVLRRMGEVYQVSTESQEAKKKQFNELLQQLRTLKKYVNGELAKIGVRYGCMVPAVTEAWRFDLHGGNRGEEVDLRAYRERILTVSEDRLAKLEGPQATDWETRLKPHIMRIEGEDTNPRYVVESWQWAGYLEAQRNILRILMGEAPLILTATGAAAVQPPRAMNPAVAAAMARGAPA